MLMEVSGPGKAGMITVRIPEIFGLFFGKWGNVGYGSPTLNELLGSNLSR
jgi:hypothetical protein